MFSLAKYSYMACSPEDRAWYDTLPAYVQIQFSTCCSRLLLQRVHGMAGLDLACREAARLGHIDCLRAARRFGYRMDESALTEALMEGNAECVDFILRDGFQTKGMRHTYSHAVRGGHIECLQALLRHGVPWDGQELKNAVVNSRADCLRFLLQHGCTTLPIRVNIAAGHSDVACVKILREYGMPWNDVTLIIANNVGNYDLIQYAVKNGCPNPRRIPVRRSARLVERRRNRSVVMSRN